MILLRAKLSRDKGLYESLPLKVKKLIEDFGASETFKFIFKENEKTISKDTTELVGQIFTFKTKVKEFEVTVLPEGYVKIEEKVNDSFRFLKLYEEFSDDFFGKLKEFFADNYKDLKDVFEMWNGKKRTVEDLLEKCAFIIDNYGVEPVRSSDQDDSYFLETVALYLNLEDEYATTIIYDVNKNDFILTSISDWKYENKDKYLLI
jgi:hypothetical protein